MTFSNEDIEGLKAEIKRRLSESRYLHTLGVARAAELLAVLCAPELVDEAVVAALLHDVSKEYSHNEQLHIISEEKISIDREDESTPAVLHSFTAPAVIKRDFEKFATPNVLSAALYHTIGSPDMSVFDEIIFLSDFIEDTRSYDSSIELRKYVFSNMKRGATEDNIMVLHNACIKSIDFTMDHLKKNKKHINSKNILTRNALLSKI